MKKLLFLFVVGLSANNLNAQLSLTASGGTTTGTYTTLKDAFDAINLGTHQGAIAISVTANTTEVATAALNASGGTANYTSLVIKPATGVTATISGAIASGTLIKILGNNVTIDGSNSVGGTTKNLTINNTAPTAPRVFLMGSSSATSPLMNVTIKNSIIINGSIVGDAVTVSDGGTAAGYFNNITIQNNTIQKALNGIFVNAVIASGNGGSTLIKDNNLAQTGSEAIRLTGIHLQGVDGATVSNNTIANLQSTTTTPEIRRGILLAAGTVNTSVLSNNISNLAFTGTNAGSASGITVSVGNTGAVPISNNVISKNTISNLSSSGTGPLTGILVTGLTSGTTISQNKISTIKNTNAGGYGASGITLSSTATNNATFVTNNFISDASAYGFNGNGAVDNGYGIVVSSGSGYKIYYNTVNLTVSQTLANGIPAAFNVTNGVTAAGAIDLRNNIFSTSQTSPTFAIYSTAPTTVFSNIDNNDYYSTGVLGFSGGNRTTLSELQTGFGSNVNSLNVQPVFVSNSDLHLVAASNATLDNKGIPIAGVTVDIDSAARNATTPDLGASEFTAILGVKDVTAKNKVDYYPNPTSDFININNAKSKILTVDAYSVTGERVISSTINANKATVDLRSLPAGMYMLNVKSESGLQTIKVIKK